MKRNVCCEIAKAEGSNRKGGLDLACPVNMDEPPTRLREMH